MGSKPRKKPGQNRTFQVGSLVVDFVDVPADIADRVERSIEIIVIDADRLEQNELFI